jgi:hypothetical protein
VLAWRGATAEGSSRHKIDGTLIMTYCSKDGECGFGRFVGSRPHGAEFLGSGLLAEQGVLVGRLRHGRCLSRQAAGEGLSRWW